jgi:hypothetical protein
LSSNTPQAPLSEEQSPGPPPLGETGVKHSHTEGLGLTRRNILAATRGPTSAPAQGVVQVFPTWPPADPGRDAQTR